MVTQEKFKICKGELAKYQITIKREDFDVKTCNFMVRLSWGLFGQYRDILKDEMYRDEDWNIFFVFETDDMTGPVKATTTYYVDDTDVDGAMRECTDIQVIGFVTDTSCQQMRKRCKPCGGTGFVEFDRIYRSDANTLYLNLRTVDGEPLRTSDGENLRVRKENLI
jgi:hypothetical protein